VPRKLASDQRRRPRQARSRATCEAIVEAASQILERHGPAALTTTRVAERAGVSIGTLYQYFAGKEAILAAAARRALAGAEARPRALVDALIDLVERLGGLGGAAAGRSATSDASPRRRRAARPRLGDLFEQALGWLAPAPTLIPIRVRSRRHSIDPRTGLPSR
jgi:AcrR family transcriptional regulator